MLLWKVPRLQVGNNFLKKDITGMEGASPYQGAGWCEHPVSALHFLLFCVYYILPFWEKRGAAGKIILYHSGAACGEPLARFFCVPLPGLPRGKSRAGGACCHRRRAGVPHGRYAFAAFGYKAQWQGEAVLYDFPAAKGYGTGGHWRNSPFYGPGLWANGAYCFGCGYFNYSTLGRSAYG